MRPRLLQRLSLMTYQVNITNVNLQLEAPCHLEAFNIIQSGTFNELCTNVSKLHSELNDMTSNVSITFKVTRYL